MDKIARALMSALLLAAIVLGAGCGFISEGRFNPDKIWLQETEESR